MTPGQAAYEMRILLMNPILRKVQNTPEWKNLMPSEKMCWEDIAQAAIAAHFRQDVHDVAEYYQEPPDETA